VWFKNKRPDGYQCCHNDGNPHNNRIENLRWDTPKGNNLDKIRHGTSGRGEKNPMAKIRNHEAMVIISCYQIVKSKTFSQYYNISISSVVGIATGKIRHDDNYKFLYEVNKKVANERRK